MHEILILVGRIFVLPLLAKWYLAGALICAMNGAYLYMVNFAVISALFAVMAAIGSYKIGE